MSREHLPQSLQALEKKTILDISRINIQALINHPEKYTQVHFREAMGILKGMEKTVTDAYAREGMWASSKEFCDSDSLENIRHYKSLLSDLIKAEA